MSSTPTSFKDGRATVPRKPKLVRITEKEAVELQWKTINNWKPKRDIWPFTFGIGILSSASAFTGAYFNNYYRRVAKLRTYGQVATLLPAVFVPSIFTALLHINFVSNHVLLADGRGSAAGACPVCIEARATAIQLLFGAVYPMVLTPLGVFSVAGRFYTYPVPPMWPVGYFVRHWWKITQPKVNAFYVITALHIVIAAAITHLEFRSIDRVNRKLIALEKSAAEDL